MRAAVFMADGFEEIEAITIIDVLRRAEIETQTVSIMGRADVLGAHDIKVYCDCVFEDMSFEGIEMLVLPGGGPGTKTLKNFAPLGDRLLEFNNDKKFLAAICAAPTVLGKYGILNGKTAVCYPMPELEDELSGAKIGADNVEVSGNIITSKAAGTAAEFAFKLVELLNGAEAAKTVAESMFY